MSIEPASNKMSRLSRWAWLPIPILLAAILALWVANLQVVGHSPAMIWLLHYGSVAIGIAFIAIPAAYSFLSGRQPSVLMLGCGILMMDIGVVAIRVALGTGEMSAGFAVYNTSTLLGALCHFTGVVVASRRKIRATRAVPWLIVAYAGSMAVMALIVRLAFTGRMPAFFVEGQGGTLLRTVVVGLAVMLFLVTAGILRQTNRHKPSPFLQWYALGLVLLATGLGGSALIAIVDSPLQWVTRSTQFVGTLYMVFAVLASLRGSSTKRIPMEHIEEAWRERGLLASLEQPTTLGWVLRYGLAIVMVCLAMGLRVALTESVGTGLPTYITFYPAVMAVAVMAGFRPGLLATALAGALVWYWVLPPTGQFGIIAPVDRLGLIVFTGMGLFMSAVAESYRRGRLKAAAYDREAAVRAAVQEEKAKLQTVLDSLAEGLIVADLDGRLVYWNPASVTMHGYSNAEEGERLLTELDDTFVLSELDGRLIPVDQWPMARILRGEQIRNREIRVRRIDRDWQRIFDYYGGLVKDDSGNPLMATLNVSDISERKKAEERERKEHDGTLFANRVLRAFVEYEGDAIFDHALAVVQEEMDSTHGVFGYISEPGHLTCPSLSKMLDECEIEGKCIHYPPEKWNGLWARALTEKRSLFTNKAPRVPPGHPIIYSNLATPILFQGEAIGLLNLANKEGGYTEEDRESLDALAARVAPVLYAWIQRKLREEERREAEEALRESEERSRAQLKEIESIYDGAHVGLAIFDRDLRYVRINERLAGLNGIPASDHIGRTVREVLPNIASLFEELAGRIFESGEGVADFELSGTTPAQPGVMRTFVEQWMPIKDESGEVIAINVVVEDITERKRTEEALARNYSLLQRALLPDKTPKFPGYEIASTYLPIPGAEIGGDFYDLFPTEKGLMAALIGDVSGKGIPAASLAAAARSTARAFTYDLNVTDEALSHTNNVLKDAKEDPSLFLTLLLVTLDSDGRMCYSSAGHPPPAIYHAGTGEVHWLEDGGADPRGAGSASVRGGLRAHGGRGQAGPVYRRPARGETHLGPLRARRHRARGEGERRASPRGDRSGARPGIDRVVRRRSPGRHGDHRDRANGIADGHRPCSVGAFELSGWRPSLVMVSRETYSRLDGWGLGTLADHPTVLLE